VKTVQTIRGLATLAAASLVAVFAVAGPAWAHTTVKSSVPAANASLKAVPASVTLTFTERLSILPKVSVEDPTGNVVNSAPATLDGSVLTQPVRPTVAGKYTVRWLATAQDGDKSNGTFKFTLTVAPPPLSPTATEAAPPPSAAAPSTSPKPVAAADSSGSGYGRLWAVAIVLVVAAVLIFLLVRRKRAPASGPAPQARRRDGRESD
jgi:methionine-rich copper-binding protein CopC